MARVLPTITYKGKKYKFMYREQLLKDRCWYQNDKGKWLMRLDKKARRPEYHDKPRKRARKKKAWKMGKIKSMFDV